MDAKSKANFINSVAAGEVIPCPNCDAANSPDAKNCAACGTELAKPASNDAPAFAQVADTESAQPATANAKVKYEEPASVFADGLPSWDIVPPQVMVRRR